MEKPRVLTDLLFKFSKDTPERVVYRYLQDDGAEQGALTFIELRDGACGLAARLAREGALGERVLILAPQGLDFALAMWGCLVAGAVAVPLALPRLNRPPDQLRHIAADCTPRFGITTRTVWEKLAKLVQGIPELAETAWLLLEDVEPLEGEWVPRVLEPNAPAYLQYTSGSTSDPRGVIITHANVLHNLDTIRGLLHVTAQDVVVSWLPLYHDMGLLSSLFMPVYVGLVGVLMSAAAFLMKPLLWLEALSRYKADFSAAPNFAFQWCLERISAEDCAGLDLSHCRAVVCGAEPIHSAVLEKFTHTFSSIGFRQNTILPAYGLAEATLIVTGTPLDSAWEELSLNSGELRRNLIQIEAPESETATPLVSCGSILPGHAVEIVDPDTSSICSENAVGEIWTSGPSVGAGYWGKPAAEVVFQAQLPGRDSPYLRTGDLGFMKDGKLYVTGRIKDLVVINGNNYYPADFEHSVDGCHPDLMPGCGVAFSIPGEGSERLVVAWELRLEARRPDVKQIAHVVRQVVGDQFQLPVHAVVLLRPWLLPRTTSGKLQHGKARSLYLTDELPVVGKDILPGGAGVVAGAALEPETSLRERLAQLWLRLLGVRPVSDADDFFALGGDSLLAAQLAVRIREEFRRVVSLEQLYGRPAWADMAALVEQAPETEREELLSLAPLQRTAPQPLSFSQERMWFVYQLDQFNTAYNITTILRVSGPLDVTLLSECFARLVERHEILRTRFFLNEGQPVQQVQAAMPPVFEHVLIEDEAQVHAALQADLNQPFDLSSGPLMRVHLYQLSDRERVLQVSVHHIAADAWSLGVILEEMRAMYAASSAGQAHQLPPLTYQYLDFAFTERARANGKAAQQTAFWRSYLANCPTLDLPLDKTRPTVQTYRGETEMRLLPAALSKNIKALARHEKVTLFSLTFGLFGLLLGRYGRAQDVVVGVPVANRAQLAVEKMVGTFVNLLPLRVHPEPDQSLHTYLKQTHQSVTQALDQGEISFSQLVAELRPDRDASRTPFFSVLFNLINVPMPPLVLGEARAELFSAARAGVQFDLSLTLEPFGESVYAILEYNTDLFEARTAAQMIDHYVTLLESACLNPDAALRQLDMIPPAQRVELLTRWNGPIVPVPDTTVDQLFEAQLLRSPGRIAVQDDQQHMTYAELDLEANRLAQALRQAGVGPEARVGICLDRSVRLVVAVLAVWKAGGAFVPLDPGFPRERLAYMLQDSAPVAVIAEEHLLELLPQSSAKVICLNRDEQQFSELNSTDLSLTKSFEDLAYILYTSGSTGRPKGVEICHQALVNFLLAAQNEVGLEAEDILLAVTTLSFDISNLELWLPLINGAQVVIVGRDTAMDGRLLAQTLERSQATVMQATPATWQMLLLAGWEGNPQLKILCGGEALTRELAHQLLEKGREIWNLYGPTETTVWSSMTRVIAGKPIRLGRPLANTQFYVLDKSCHLAPLGVLGELFIGGAGLARGYWNRPELTQERFSDFAPHLALGRLYRTGDMVCRHSDGTLEFMGRTDLQVKIRGFRIELEEIESALLTHPAVRESVVNAWRSDHGEPRLAAYLVASTPHPSAAELRAHLSQSLPDYMLPAAYTFLEALPLTPNRKVDRRALPVPNIFEATSTASHILPKDGLEAALVKLWEEALEISPVGVTDSFFEMGGSSLLAVRLFAQIEKRFGKPLPLSLLYQQGTIRGLADWLRSEDANRAWDSLVPLQPRGSQLPLFIVHPLDGDVAGFKIWASYLGENQPLYGLRAAGLDGVSHPMDNLPRMAAHYLTAIRHVQPGGPYRLAGYCAGSAIAFEMAQQLYALGEKVETLVLINQPPPHSDYYRVRFTPSFIFHFLRNLPAWIRDWMLLERRDQMARITSRMSMKNNQEDVEADIQRLGLAAVFDLAMIPPEIRPRLVRYYTAMDRALNDYQPKDYPGPATVVHTRRQPLLCSYDPYVGWSSLVRGGLTCMEVPGSNTTILSHPDARPFGLALSQIIKENGTTPPGS